MKLLVLLLLLPFAASAQLTYYIRSDSVKIEKNGGSNELFIKNSTRTVNGLLTNIGGGRTQFIAPRRVGDTLFVGVDTLRGFNISTSGQRFGFATEDTRATATRSFSMGGNGFSMDSAQSILLRSRGGSMGTRTHLIQSSGTGIAQTRLRAQSSLYTTAFAQLGIINTNEARPEITLTVVDTSLNGTSMTLKGDTILMSIDGSTVGANIRYIMENMPTTDNSDTTTFKPVVMDGDNVYKMTAWPSLGSGGGGVTAHSALTGLTTGDDHTQYALLAGRASGQTLIGGTGTTDDLVLRTTSGAGTSGADMIFQTGNNGATEAMRINSAGELLVNTTTDAGTFSAQIGGPLYVGTVGSTTSFQMNNASNLYAEVRFSQNGLSRYAFGQGGSGAIAPYQNNAYQQLLTGSNNFVWISTANAAIATLTDGGNLGIGGTPSYMLSVGSSSDFGVSSSGKIAEYANSAPTNGQILIGDGTDFEKATITPGTGISVTNGAGSVTISVPTSFITQGTYTPTPNNTTNISASTVSVTGYYRVGDAVTVFGTLTVTPTAELTACELGLSLPVASNFAASTEGGGAGSLLNTTSNRSDVSINMDATNDRARFSFNAPADSSPITLTFQFSYRVTTP